MSISLKTTPRDPRFPNTNQAQHCWTRFNEFVLCAKRTGEGIEDAKSGDCTQAFRFAASLCPNEKIEQWTEEVESGAFPGIQLNDEE